MGPLLCEQTLRECRHSKNKNKTTFFWFSLTNCFVRVCFLTFFFLFAVATTETQYVVLVPEPSVATSGTCIFVFFLLAIIKAEIF